jgi:hypothetical protein
VPESTLYRSNYAVVLTDLTQLDTALSEFKIVVALGAWYSTCCLLFLQ